MDTTSDIQALADTLVQTPNETGENLKVPDTKSEAEPVQAVDEIPQEEIEPVDLADEAEDESPSDTIELDGENDDYDLTEVAETDTLIPVKINGKEEQWTLDQLKQSAAGQGYINQQMQEVAKLKKEYTAYLQQATQQRERELAFIQKAQQIGIKEPTPPSRETFDQDPIDTWNRSWNTIRRRLNTIPKFNNYKQCNSSKRKSVSSNCKTTQCNKLSS